MMNKKLALDHYTEEAVELLARLVATPSFSKEEDQTAQIIADFLTKNEIPYTRIGNNIIAQQEGDKSKPVWVLNSHHDTVRPSAGWTYEPFQLTQEGDRLTGLGSNDAGGCLVSLILTFRHFYRQTSLPFRLILIASAEEEISGAGGLKRALTELNFTPDLAIVGEPTSTNMAIAEKGLLVIDGYAKGKAGHAAHQIGDNALLKAVQDIQALQKVVFEQVSELLGPVKITVTQISAGSQHNVVPDHCHFVCDCRVNEHYTNKEVLAKLQAVCVSTLTPRSTHLGSSSIALTHPLIQVGGSLGKSHYGSPTLSDQVFYDCPSLKIGPGESTRSHQADEYILRSEITEGIRTYIGLLDGFSQKS